MSPRLPMEWASRLGLLASSALLSVLLCEALLRVVLPPGDVLMPILTKNDVLGVRIRPGTTGFDQWGFRNPTVPGRVDVVAVGDSFTYGYSAGRADAWPSQLARISDVSVYNLGMGGWGPEQYYCALRIFGLRLRPRAFVIGFYLANDLQDEARAGDVSARCESMSPESLSGLDRETLVIAEDHRTLGVARHWLAEHSVLYQALKLGLPRLMGSISSRLVLADGYTSREIRGHTVILHGESWLATDRDLVGVGLAHLGGVLDRLQRLCRDHRLDCVVVLIPSREAIYAELVPDLRGLKEEMDLEVAIAERLKSGGAGRLVFVDPLRALRQAVIEGKQIFPNSEDIHFNATGYAVLAQEIARGLGAVSR